MLEQREQPIIVNQVRRPFLAWLFSQLTDDPVSEHFYRRTRSWMSVPLVYQGNMVGMMRVDKRQPDFFTQERVNLLAPSAAKQQWRLCRRGCFSRRGKCLCR